LTIDGVIELRSTNGKGLKTTPILKISKTQNRQQSPYGVLEIRTDDNVCRLCSDVRENWIQCSCKRYNQRVLVTNRADI